MKKIIRVFLMIVLFNLLVMDTNFCDGFMDFRDYGNELVAISTLYEVEVNNGKEGMETFVSKMNHDGVRISEPNENCIQGEVHGGKFFMYIAEDNTRGKIRITSSTLELHYEIMNRIEDIRGISLFVIDTNVKYTLKENIDRTSKKILSRVKKKELKCEMVNLNRGYEIIVSKPDRLFGTGKRIGNYILVEYGNSSCIIFGENEIFMDY